eukprot:gene56707-biopygen37992
MRCPALSQLLFQLLLHIPRFVESSPPTVSPSTSPAPGDSIWEKILQYSNAAYTPTTGASGDIRAPPSGGFAKLADADINAMPADASGPTCGPTVAPSSSPTLLGAVPERRWVKVLQYGNTAYAPTTNASGDINADPSAGFAKLADTAINDIVADDAGYYYYRLVSSTPTDSTLYVRAYFGTNRSPAPAERNADVAPHAADPGTHRPAAPAGSTVRNDGHSIVYTICHRQPMPFVPPRAARPPMPSDLPSASGPGRQFYRGRGDDHARAAHSIP